ncbi:MULTISPECIES: cell division protein [Acidobacteriaceae]|uniref:SRPBCC family protein n=1 Tax=Acidobacteriaceae TaxID=204434 RepID=UPI00131C21C6|nr:MULTISPECIES: cell division protein [Acidobacteriaceae]MDW5265634.1 cell division protein [Edaphobacter sp.]
MERCFTLATSIDLLLAAAAETQEKAIGGVTSGLIGEGESVRWRGRHLGRWRTHTCKVDGWRPFSYFREVMTDGPFVRFEHEHHFAVMDDGTRMRDEIHFAASGMMARMVEKVARRHLISILRRRNALIKRTAESEEWRRYLEGNAVTPSTDRVQNESRVERWDKSAVGG